MRNRPLEPLGDGLVDLDRAEQPVVAVTAVRGGVAEGEAGGVVEAGLGLALAVGGGEASRGVVLLLLLVAGPREARHESEGGGGREGGGGVHEGWVANWSLWW